MAIQLFIDVVNKKLVRSRTDQTIAALSPIYFSTKLDMQLFPLEPNPSFNVEPLVPYNSFDWSSYAISVEVGVADAESATTPAAVTTTFSNISGGKSGELDLNTAGIQALLAGGISEIQTNFEIKATPPGGFPDVVIQQAITLKGVVLDTGGTPPASLPDYILRSEALASFVKKVGLPGETVTFTSPNGLFLRILGVRDDGSRQDDIIPL